MKRIITFLLACIVATLIVSSVIYFVLPSKHSFLETMGLYYPVGIFAYLVVERDKRDGISIKKQEAVNIHYN